MRTPDPSWPQEAVPTVSTFPAAAHRALVDAERRSQLGQHAPLASVLEHDVVAPVAGLGFACGPDAVPRLVSAIVIDSLHRVLRAGPRPHVGYVVDEALSAAPALANGDATASVAGVAPAGLAVTASDHAVPSVPVRRARLMVNHPQAPAGLDAFQVDGADDSFAAAFAPTKPLRMPVRAVLGTRQEGEAADDLASAVFKCSHVRNPNTGCGRICRKSTASRT